MIEYSLVAWLWMAGMILLATLSGLSLSRLVTWNPHAMRAGVPAAFGIAIAPLLLGIGSVLALGVLPGKSHQAHLFFIAFFMIALVGLGLIKSTRSRVRHSRYFDKTTRADRILALLIVLWTGAMLIDAVFMPLTQNDALEYATVGRRLFEVRDLYAYPMLDAAQSPSGFYGPWTHPPLYVALIYLAYALQGHADAPGLLRLIAPWFALAATGLVYALGRMHHKTTGLAAALVFLSAPLFFLGAGSALIDSLPVLGMALFLGAVFAVEGSPFRRGLIQGVVLGLALWTHSQAILFVPLGVVALIAFYGVREPRALMLQILTMLSVALLLAFWPYWRNMQIYGSPISDNPIVFALPQLNWPEYFTMARGYGSYSEKIQYGVFKGWAMPESYSLAFWLMLPGVLLFLRSTSIRSIFMERINTESFADGKAQWFRVVLAIVLCYLCGVVASIMVGVDLMIRNERYLLVLLPCVALFAGLFVNALLISANNCGVKASVPDSIGWKRRLPAFFFALFLVIAALQLLVIGGHKWRTYGVNLSNLASPLDEKLRGWPAYEVTQYIHAETEEQATILSMKPADMYYSGRRMMSYLDPRMVPVYEKRDPAVVREMLSHLGVRYIHVPDYALPPIYNSAIQDIMARPDLSRIVYSVGGHQVYDLKTSVAPKAIAVADMSPKEIPWSVSRLFVIGGRTGIFRVSLSDFSLPEDGAYKWDIGMPLFHRERSIVIASGAEGLFSQHGKSSFQPVTGGAEYRIDLDLSGHAFVGIYLVQYNRDGRPLILAENSESTVWPNALDWRKLSEQRIGEMAIGSDGAPRRFSRRFVTYSETAFIRVALEYRGDNVVRIVKSNLLKIE